MPHRGSYSYLRQLSLPHLQRHPALTLTGKDSLFLGGFGPYVLYYYGLMPIRHNAACRRFGEHNEESVTTKHDT